MRISVDQDKCCSSGLCAMTAPKVFDQSDYDGVVELLDAEPAEPLQDAVRTAADMCPAQAISVS
ncbi:MAG: ferredoxin [Actinomycetota bacterium]|nr:ferredoxin [Actinomycetota bacterium]MDQ2955378.1 ferredoxin [Actinomycetota bacterium]